MSWILRAAIAFIQQGINIREMLAGAAIMDEASRITEVSSCSPTHLMSLLSSPSYFVLPFVLIWRFIYFQLKKNPAALLALCWYWASGGVGSKVRLIHYF